MPSKTNINDEKNVTGTCKCKKQTRAFKNTRTKIQNKKTQKNTVPKFKDTPNFKNVEYNSAAKSPVGVGNKDLHVGVALDDAHRVLGRDLTQRPHRTKLQGRLHGREEQLREHREKKKKKKVRQARARKKKTAEKNDGK